MVQRGAQQVGGIPMRVWAEPSVHGLDTAYVIMLLSNVCDAVELFYGRKMDQMKLGTVLRHLHSSCGLQT